MILKYNVMLNMYLLEHVCNRYINVSAIVICIKHFSMTCERPLSFVIGIIYLMYGKKVQCPSDRI